MREGWEEVAVGEIAEVVSGATPKTGNEGYWNGDIPWLTPKDLSNKPARYTSAGERSITKAGLASCSARLLPAGSVLLTSRAPVGYVSIAASPISTNQGFKSLVLREGQLPEFWYYLLMHSKDYLESHSGGSTFKELSGLALKALRFWVPPLSEQRRIANLMGAVDDAIDAMQEATERNRESFKAIAESLPGQLTPLDEVLLAIEAGRSPSGVERVPAPGERAVLKVSAIGSGTFNAMEVKVVSPDTRLDERTAISRGDVLMVRANGVIKRVGAVCQVREDYEQLFLCDKTLRLVPDPDRLDSRWLNSALSSAQSRRQIEALTTGSHMRNITQQAIRQIKIPLPNIDEQAMLSAALESLIEAREALCSHTDKLAALRAELLAVLLSGAHRIPETYDELVGA